MQIQKCFRLAVAALAFTLAAAASDAPRFESYLGYDFTRYDSSHSLFPNLNMNGATGQFVYNAWHGVGIVFDGGAVTKGVLNGNDVDTTLAHFLIGPRFALHNHGKFSPFVQITFGGYYLTASTRIQAFPVVSPNAVNPIIQTPITARLNTSHSDFAMMAGGGIDYKINRHVAFRPFEADYYLTRSPGLVCSDFGNGCVPGSVTTDTLNQSNWRLTAGVNFMWGAKK
jgi:hypothetical protein